MNPTVIIQSIKVAADVAKGISSLSKEVAVNTKAAELLAIINDLHRQMLELQEKHEALIQSEREWKGKALRREAWAEVKRGYSRHKVGPGATVYTSNADGEPTAENDWYCVRCMDSEEAESILQLQKRSLAEVDYICPNCKSTIVVPSDRESSFG